MLADLGSSRLLWTWFSLNPCIDVRILLMSSNTKLSTCRLGMTQKTLSSNHYARHASMCQRSAPPAVVPHTETANATEPRSVNPGALTSRFPSSPLKIRVRGYPYSYRLVLIREPPEKRQKGTTGGTCRASRHKGSSLNWGPCFGPRNRTAPF